MQLKESAKRGIAEKVLMKWGLAGSVGTRWSHAENFYITLSGC
jgi:hypothetical protein